jgi:hypothetical protein
MYLELLYYRFLNEDEFMQKRIVGFLITVFVGISLTIIPQVKADDEWDGNRKRRPSKREGRTVQMDTISGQIMEIIESRHNIFLRVGSADSSQWVALMSSRDGGNIPKVQVGDTVTLQSGVVMNNYHIKGLKRDFDQVIFSPGIAQHSTSPPEPTTPEPTDTEPTWRDRYNRDSYDRDGYDSDRYNRDSDERDSDERDSDD